MINTKRLITGGLVAGLLMNVITGFGNAVVFNSAFQSWSTEMGGHIHPPAQGSQMGLWVLMSFINGFVSVWLYAGLRPRFGAGPKTALVAGLALWIIGRFCGALDLIALGVFPLDMMIGQALLGLLAILVSVFVGAWIYRE